MKKHNKIIILIIFMSFINFGFSSDENTFLIEESKNFTFILQNDYGDFLYSADCNNSLFYNNGTNIFYNLSMTLDDLFYYIEYNNTYWNNETGTYLSQIVCNYEGSNYIFYYDIFVKNNYTDNWLGLIYTFLIDFKNNVLIWFNYTWGNISLIPSQVWTYEERNVSDINYDDSLLIRLNCFFKIYNSSDYITYCEDTIKNTMFNFTIKHEIKKFIRETGANFFNESMNQKKSEEYNINDCFNQTQYVYELANLTNYAVINLIYTGFHFSSDFMLCYFNLAIKGFSGVVLN